MTLLASICERQKSARSMIEKVEVVWKGSMCKRALRKCRTVRHNRILKTKFICGCYKLEVISTAKKKYRAIINGDPHPSTILYPAHHSLGSAGPVAFSL